MTSFAPIFATSISVGLAAGFATSFGYGLLAGVAAAIGTTLMLVAIYRVRGVRHFVMEVMHRVTGQ